MQPPHPVQILHEETHHGFVKSDEYHWLRDDNWQQVMHNPSVLNADIRAHIEAENVYTQHVLASAEDLRQKLFDEMRGRVEENAATVPVNAGAYAWNTRYRVDDEHPLICRGPRDCHPDETDIIVDCNALADGQAYFKLITSEKSEDNKRLALAMDFSGGEFLTIRIFDTVTRDFLSDRLERAADAMAWSADGHTLFYILLDDNHRPYQVMRHQLGQAQSDDICVYEENDAGFFLSLDTSASGRFIIIYAHDHETTESRLIDTHAPDDSPICVAPRKTGVQYTVEDDAARNQLIILTNWQEHGRADDFQIVTAPLAKPTQEQWQTLVPHQEGHLILALNSYNDHLVMLIRANALPYIKIINMSDGQAQNIAFDEAAYDLVLHANAEYQSDILRFTYSSMTTPAEVYDYDMIANTRKLRRSQIIPSGHDPHDYVTERLWATGHDGAQIPISVVYHKETETDGTAPVLLYGYGSYGITLPATFSNSRLSLVQRGFIYAIAHIRGGKACGYKWFEQGRRAQKQNTFKDFIAAAEHLIDIGYVRKGNISIHGGSAGGLLLGACMNMAPDLFCAAVAEVPFVDTLTTMLDDSLPLTPPEWPEWGNPKASATDYQTIAAYAPYENVGQHAYPHILATAGLTDPRVTYWEPAKWVARLRDRRTDDGMTLLKTEMEAGHGGQAGRFNQLKEDAFIYSFILHCHSDRTENNG
jgi:oligopeptidase B